MKPGQPSMSLLLYLIYILGGSLVFSSCGEDPVVEEGLKITGISIPAEIYASPGEAVEITAKGFEADDMILLASTTEPDMDYLLPIDSLGETAITFVLPDEFTSGSYNITAVRDPETQVLGTVRFNVTSGSDIPDIEGMTIKGIVYCNGVGIPDVIVSDGYEVTRTDENGIYYLPSEKEKEYVFISIPGNYEVANDNNLPLFFKRLSGGSTVERKDFSLFEADNSKHVVLTMADWHLADRNSDLNQFSQGFLQDVNATIEAYISSGTRVYGLTLGDMTWDLFWYSNDFAMPEYVQQMNKINCGIFNTIGNHDHDPYAAGDWLGGLPFIENLCPNYYSFNLGDVHYVVLDDVNYINSGGSEGVIGSRNYTAVVDTDQLSWLEKDLAMLSDKNTPIIVAMHIPFFDEPYIEADGSYDLVYRLSNGSTVQSVLDAYSNVHVLSGHAHSNFTAEASPSFMEHNIGAVCATWWWTGKPGYAGNHTCPDGSPGGYGIWEVDATDLEWSYKSTGYEGEYQFRTYDLNTVHITADKYAPNSTDEKLAPYVGDYGSPSSANEVLINIWNYDKEWTLEVLENGTELEITQSNAQDPLHIISYACLRLDAGKTPTFHTDNSPHFFKVKASSPTSSLTITATDRFGNVYTEVMERPKELTYDMR